MNHLRHLDIYKFPPGFSITLIGAGGIGAITALTLAKMGLPILNVFDDDEVNETNLPGQLYRLSDVGQSKVESLQRTIFEFADDTDVSWRSYRVTHDTGLPRSDIVISAVDSIAARQAIWGAVCGSNARYYLDARMAAEEYQHFAMDMSDEAIKRYHAQLVNMNEDDVEELPCTAKATIFTGMMAAGHIATVVRNIVRGEFTSHRLVHFIPSEVIHKFNI